MTRVFVNGTFDIVHRGHLEMLEYARSLGDEVLVAIDSDRRVKELKGGGRPINNQTDRQFMLESLKYVDRVCIFDSDAELINTIKQFDVDVMVKGSDYKGYPIIGQEYCKHIEFFKLINEYSTTKTIQHIADRRRLH
jgi:D-beta-D-heptose 7-phosphate kinase/D-beta-D-heptose 1-phosphate adenosyltransferase